MANLIVRNIVEALKQRASRNGVRAEPEHRNILKQVLPQPTKKVFTEALSLIPNVGNDSDFERVQDDTTHDLFAGYQCHQ